MGASRNLQKLQECIWYYERANGSRVYYVRYRGKKIKGFETAEAAIAGLEALRAGQQPEIPKTKRTKAQRGWKAVSPGVYSHVNRYGTTVYAVIIKRQRVAVFNSRAEAEAEYKRQKQAQNAGGNPEAYEKWKKTLPELSEKMTQDERDEAVCLACKWHGTRGSFSDIAYCRYSLVEGNRTRRALMRDRTGSDRGHLTHGEHCTEFERGDKPPQRFLREG